MEWSEEDVKSAVERAYGSAGDVGRHTLKGVRAIMTRAVELKAARGGTMTAEQIESWLRPLEIQMGRPWTADAIRQHITALGARNAVLEAERDAARETMLREAGKFLAEIARADRNEDERDAAHAEVERLKAELTALKPSGQVAQYVEILSKSIAWSDGCCNRPECVDQGEDALDRLATMAQRAERAEQAESVWRKRVEDAAAALAEVARGEVGRLDLVAKVKRLMDRCTALSIAGQALSEHVDKTAGEPCPGNTCDGLTCESEAPPPRPVDMDLMCSACRQCTAHRWAPSPDAGPGWRCSECSALSKASRYPCSPTCTHDDASTPGHPERVKERSEAFTKQAVENFAGCQNDRERTCYAAGRERGLDEGVEAMRAACWEAVQEELRFDGVSPETHAAQWGRFKSAIEGATP